MNIVQRKEVRTEIHGEGRLQAIETVPLTRLRRREPTFLLTAQELKVFKPVKSAIGRLAKTISPFCSFCSSIFQQIAPSATIPDPNKQSASIHKRNLLKTFSKDCRPSLQTLHFLSVLIFCDAESYTDVGQISVVCNL